MLLNVYFYFYVIAEVPDFREGESGSDGEPDDDDIESSEEEEDDGEEEEEEDGSDDEDAKPKKQVEEGEEEEESDDEDEDEDEEQDALDADLAPSSEDEEEDAEEDDEEAAAAMREEQEHVGFLEGGKSETFARAFARIIDSSAPQTEQVLAAPILAGSKSLAARKAEDEEEAKVRRAAKKLRLEMRQRGHVVPKRRGADPVADVREKSFQKTATRGVVRLFNAVAKAQRRLREEQGVSGSRAKAAKLGKASFLAELRNYRAAAAGEGGTSEAVVPSARPTSEAAAAGGVGGGGDSDSDEEGAGAGWDVLQKGFTGLQGGNKMKDWDKQVSEDESDGPGDDMSDDDE
jgi:hypothetical protein